MNKFQSPLGQSGLFCTVAFAAGLLAALCSPLVAAEPQLRGAWMHANFIRTPAETADCVDRLQRANFNAVFLLVWYWGGQAGFHSEYCPMLEGVQPGHDPMGAMIQECHRRKIEVHAWFVNGSYGHPQPLHVLDQHPDWAVDSGPKPDLLWYDLGKPEVRKFQSDLMIEALTRYDLDGIHFDYIRYNGPAMCYCRHCQTEFASRYGCGSFEPLQRKAFPLAAMISGNPVAGPTTAVVLAQFSDGSPAIATNELGQGKVLLFNWHALRVSPAPALETIGRSVQKWDAPRDKVFVVDTEPNRARYGDKGPVEAADAFRKLGYEVVLATEERLDHLPADALVVLPDVYLIPDAFAESLEKFVRGGGRLIVVDGPVLSIRNPAIQRVVGMQRPGKYFNRLEAVVPAAKNDLLPADDLEIDLAELGRKQAKWVEYRKSGVTELVRNVYERAKRVKPHSQVTAAVFSSLASAENVYQDWPGWIREGIVDYVVPMAYTTNNDVLARQMAEWVSVDPQLERIVPGLGIFAQTEGNKMYVPRDLETILTQHGMCMDRKARGTVFFALDGTAANPVLLLNEPLIQALRDGPFKTQTPAYRPPAK